MAIFKFTLSVAFGLILSICLTAMPSYASRAKTCLSVFATQMNSLDIQIRYNDRISPRIFEHMSSDDLAREVVQWVRFREMKEIFKHSEYQRIDLMKNSQIVLFFHGEDSASIQKRGFLNQYQSGKSSGWMRDKEIEDGFLGLRIPRTSDPNVLKFRPKSAFLNISAPVELAHYRGVVSDRYGNVGAVLKDDVKQRSLWSSHDSAVIGGFYPEFLRAPEQESSLHSERGTFDRGFFPRNARDESRPSGSVPYAEAQIYGELTVEDVDHFVVFSADSITEVARFGKPIYLVSWKIEQGRDQIDYIRLLQEGRAPSISKTKAGY